VAVVPAGVHAPVPLRAPGNSAGLDDRQGVDIAAQRHMAPFRLCRQPRNRSGLSARGPGNPETVEIFADQRGSFLLLPGQFGLTMKVSAKAGGSFNQRLPIALVFCQSPEFWSFQHDRWIPRNLAKFKAPPNAHSKAFS